MTLSCTLTPRSGDPPQTFRGLNDVVLRAAPAFHLLEIGLSIDGEDVITYRGDGLIVSTPVGSTAHSLSAGGPILPPNAESFVVTPLCAHTLTQRPLVDGHQKVYELTPRAEGVATVLVVDGQVQVCVEAGDRIDDPPGRSPLPDHPLRRPLVLPDPPRQARLGSLPAGDAWRRWPLDLNESRSAGLKIKPHRAPGLRSARGR